ncbi:MAG: hypothetical protein ACYDD6_04460, partial [Acidimicrobiales bacterium]
TTRQLWCASSSGMLRSVDGGNVWTSENAGLRSPTTAWALGLVRGTLFGSDALGVYRWTGRTWLQASDQYDVVALDALPGGRLVAGSMGDGVRTWRGAGWQTTTDGLVGHAHGVARGIHVVSATALRSGRVLVGLTAGGAAESIDGGGTWEPIWTQLGSDGVVWRVTAVGRRLYAATDAGLFSAALPAPAPVRWWWWEAVVGTGLAAGAAGVVVGSRRRVVGMPEHRERRAAPGRIPGDGRSTTDRA